MNNILQYGRQKEPNEILHCDWLPKWRRAPTFAVLVDAGKKTLPNIQTC